MIRIAINGYGRIGHCILRSIFDRGLEDEFRIVAINDLANDDMMVHLTRFDSTLGRFNHEIHQEDNSMVIKGIKIPLFTCDNPADLPWKDLDVDICLECSGHFAKRELANQHLIAGAKKVLVSQPCEGADKTIVYGVNQQILNSGDTIVSNASCTTNCLAPIIKLLNDIVGVEYGNMTTIHAYTNDQNLIDKAPGDFYRSRSATQSMIPTKTGAARAVGLVLPELDGKLNGMAVRVPTINVSLIDLHVHCNKVISVDELHAAIRQAAEAEMKDILAYNELPLVSIDFIHHPASCIFDANHTTWTNNQLKVMCWYDNEWAFSLRMLDTAKVMHQLN